MGGRPLGRIGIVTGSRAEYGLLRPVMEKVAAERELSVIVAGQHLLAAFGETWHDIEADGWPIAAKVPMMSGEDDHAAMSYAIGTGVTGFTTAYRTLDLDAVIVLGDRVEAFAGATAAAASGRVLLHIHGGEVTRGGLDESMRHAISKLAHIHFVATARSQARLVRMGEPPDRIVVSGAPGLDTILHVPPLDREALADALGVTLGRPLAVLAQHPVTTELDAAGDDLRESLEALRALHMQTVALYPNSDAGGRRMIQVLESYRDEPWLTIRHSLPHRVYLSLLRHADVLVGNSSSGLLEAPSFGLPAVNVGSRQAGRERGHNVLDVAPDRAAIAAAIASGMTDERFRAELAARRNPYGDGRAGERIAATLGRIEVTAEFLQKQFWDED